ncbi:MAG: class I SAM-dependent methyltransferase [Pseudohongiellaceae bacterium]
MTTQLKFRDSLKLIKNFKTSGTITPSSPRLIRRLLSSIEFEPARCIVELGPGNGCVTHELLRRMHKDSILISFELNPEFFAQLQLIRDSRLHVVNVCASTIRDVLDGMGIDKVDHIVSSLPLALIDATVVDSILHSASVNLKSGGRFLQYQYSLKNYSDMKPIFSEVNLRFTFANMPPAFVYDCVK